MKILRVGVSILAAAALVGLSVWAGAQSADAPAAPSTQNPRIALVIGEESYPDQTLATSANDAGLVAQVLQAAGFDVVGARDLDEKSIRTALRDFLTRADAAGPNMQAFIYLAGRAVQYEGDNYFVPVDAQIAHGADVPIEAVRLTDFTHALASAPGLAQIVVLDGARANPYARAGAPLAGGLALVDPEPGELVAFNASPGSIAADEPGPYGSYAKTLAGSMRQGGVAIEDIFAQTRLAVNEASGGAQLPWSASKLTAPYYIFERAADAPPPAAEAALAEASRRPIKSFSKNDAYAAAVQRDTLRGYQDFLAAYPDSAQARRVRAILAGRREALFWRRSVEQNSPHAYWTYLRRYPRGPHAGEADERLARLSAREEPPRDFEPEVYSDLPPPPRDELVYADRPYYVFVGPDYGPPPPPPSYVYEDEDDDWRDLPPPPPPTVLGVLPALAVAVPLLLTARAYHDAGYRDGHAEPGAPPPRPVPSAPPPLPPGVHVVQAPPGAKFQKPLPTPTPSTAATPAPPAKTTPQPTTAPLPTPGPSAAPKSPSPTPTPLAKTPQPAPLPTPAPSATPKPVPKSEGAPAPLAKTPQPTPTPSATLRPVPKSEGEPAPLAKTPQPTPTPSAPLKPAPKNEGAPPPLAKTPQPTPTPSAPLKPAPKNEGAPAPLAKTPQPTPTPSAPLKPAPKNEGAPAPLAKTPQPTPVAKPAPVVAPAPVVHSAPPPPPPPVVHSRRPSCTAPRPRRRRRRSCTAPRRPRPPLRREADLRQTAVAGMPEIAWRSDQRPSGPYCSSRAGKGWTCPCGRGPRLGQRPLRTRNDGRWAVVMHCPPIRPCRRVASRWALCRDRPRLDVAPASYRNSAARDLASPVMAGASALFVAAGGRRRADKVHGVQLPVPVRGARYTRRGRGDVFQQGRTVKGERRETVSSARNSPREPRVST